MKTMKMAALAVVGLALAAPAWAHSEAALLSRVKSVRPDTEDKTWPKHPTEARPFGEVSIDISEVGPHDSYPNTHFTVRVRASVPADRCSHRASSVPRCQIVFYRAESTNVSRHFSYDTDAARTGKDVVLVADTDYTFAIIEIAWGPHMGGNPNRNSWYYTATHHVHYRSPPSPNEEPETPEPEPEPETPEPEPEPETPEPEPEPETPDHSHPVQRCDHLAIVPTIPGALAGDEDAPDHWLHVANPGAAGITFTVTGRDMAGTKGGTYRRELPAYQSVKVKMRDIESAFDVPEPEGWWTLTVTGSGPLYVAATMRQGDARRFIPVMQPEICESR